jgi:ABC-type Na+ efflux pump permease subunit
MLGKALAIIVVLIASFYLILLLLRGAFSNFPSVPTIHGGIVPSFEENTRIEIGDIKIEMPSYLLILLLVAVIILMLIYLKSGRKPKRGKD